MSRKEYFSFRLSNVGAFILKTSEKRKNFTFLNESEMVFFLSLFNFTCIFPDMGRRLLIKLVAKLATKGKIYWPICQVRLSNKFALLPQCEFGYFFMNFFCVIFYLFTLLFCFFLEWGGGVCFSFCPMTNWGTVSNCRHLRSVTCRTGSKSIWRATHEIWREIVTSRK